MSQLTNFSTGGGGGAASSFQTDAGIATPLLGVINIVGGNNIGTIGAGNSVVISLEGTTNHAVQIGNVGGSLTSLAVGANGQTIMGSTGADPSWTSSPQFGGSVTALNDISTTAGNLVSLTGNIYACNTANNTTSSTIAFKKTRIAGAISSGDTLGSFRFTGYDGTQDISSAKITSTNSGTVAATRVAGDLQFYTHPDAAIALPSEPILRMTINSAGNITVANPDAGTALTVTAGGLTVSAGDINATLGNIAAGATVSGLTVRTSDTAHYTNITDVSLTTAGTDVNIPFGITTKGSGALTIDTAGGGISFRDVTAGFLVTRWHTNQATVQTADATPTAIVTIPLVNSLMVSVKAIINGFESTYGDCVGGEIMVTAYRAAAGNIILVGAPIINVNYTDLVGTSDIDAVIDVGTQSLKLNVIGVAAQNWNWVTTYSYMYTIDNT